MIKSEKKRKPRIGPKSQSSVPAFLVKTYEILENPEYSDIISWNKEGTAFIVKKINDFAEKILPKYFKHSNFASFVRQLNMYDFHKARHDNNENEFKHRSFKRGSKHLLGDIKRKTAENPPSPSPNQLVPVNKEFDFEKFKKDCNLFSGELGTIKTRQGELEKITKVLFNQNNSLVRENKLLWNELLKSKDKYERKIEKLMYFIFSMMQYNGNAQISSFNNKKGIEADLADALGDLQDDPNISKKLHDGTALSLRAEKMSKEQERTLKKAFKMFQSKDEPNLDALIDGLQDPSKVLNGYPGVMDEFDDLPNDQAIETKPKKKVRTKKMATNFDDDDFEVFPKKLIKNDMIDQNDLNPKQNHNAIIEDMPISFQRQYSDSDYRPYNNYNGSIPLPNGDVDSPKPYGSFNGYPDMFQKDILLEKKDSYDIPFLSSNAFISPQPQSPGMKFNPDEDFDNI